MSGSIPNVRSQIICKIQRSMRLLICIEHLFRAVTLPSWRRGRFFRLHIATIVDDANDAYALPLFVDCIEDVELLYSKTADAF